VNEVNLSHDHRASAKDGQLRSTIESKETHPEDKATESSKKGRMAGDVVHGAIRVKPSDPRTNNNGADQGSSPSHAMNDGAACIIDHAELCQPTSSIPDPVCNDRVDEPADHAGVNQISPEVGSLGKGPAHDGRCGRAEDELEEDPGVVGGVNQEELACSNERVRAGFGRSIGKGPTHRPVEGCCEGHVQKVLRWRESL